MLVLLLHLFLHCELITSDRKAKFNEALLMEQHHQQVLQVNAFIDGVQQTVQTHRPKLRTMGQTHETPSNEDFLDYHVTNVWWTDSPGLEQGYWVTLQTTFLPTPMGHGKFTAEKYNTFKYTLPKEQTVPFELQDMFPTSSTTTKKDGHLPPAFATRPSFPFPIPSTVTDYPKLEITLPPTPMHPLYPDLPLPPGFPLNPQTTTVYPPPEDNMYIYKPNETRFTHGFPGFDLPFKPIRPAPSFLTSTYTPVPSYPVTSTSEESSSTPVETEAVIPSTARQTYKMAVPNLSEFVKNWLKERANHTYSYGVTYILPEPDFLTENATANETTTTTVRVTTTTLKPTTTTRLTQTSSQPPPTWPTDSLHWLHTLPVQSNPWLHEDGSLVFPSRHPPEQPGSTDATSLGDAIFGNITVGEPSSTTTLAYQDVMDSLHEGYMMVFLIELTALIALKEPAQVHEVIVHTEPIIYFFNQNGYLLWLSRPLMQITIDLAVFISTNETDVIQSYATMLHRMLIERKLVLSEEVNSIIDYAQSLYEPSEGKLLYDTVKEFGDYPNTSKEGYWICDGLIQSFLAPYQRLGPVEQRQKLVDSVTKALIARFPEYDLRRFNEEFGVLDGGLEPWIRDPHDEPTPHSRAQRKTKRTRRSNRRNRHTPRHRKHNRRHRTNSDHNIQRRQYRERTKYEYPILRSMKPITMSTVQKRYSIVTSKYHFRQMKVRSTTRYYINLMTRPTKDQALIERNRGRSYNKPIPLIRDPRDVHKANYKRLIHPDDDKDRIDVVRTRKALEDKAFFYHQVKERFKAQKEAESVKLKAELLRKIVEGSSYSDEEASLKMNLIQALLLGNRSVVVDGGHTRQ